RDASSALAVDCRIGVLRPGCIHHPLWVSWSASLTLGLRQVCSSRSSEIVRGVTARRRATLLRLMSPSVACVDRNFVSQNALLWLTGDDFCGLPFEPASQYWIAPA